MVSASLLATLLLALAVAGSPAIVVEKSLVTLPISKRFNFNGTYTIAQRDQLRAKALKAGSSLSGAFDVDNSLQNDASSPATNQAVIYIATVGVGSPSTYCK